ncbi:Uu.00g088990.m01.CDS01 [Anthostomella pinea]|uniref:Uu.00g088990.m01.CDS01 n=1 Tax=Anthostomella pinea TaxID=933095 RepID=A0AAI8YK97_9PEZI|nr:Uu.00g088990.m01.CDS01 [Anthostomella pinea]
MVALRISNSLSAMRAVRTRAPQVHRTFVTASRFQAKQGYGDGEGNPVGENPQKQPSSSGAQESSEHPGPAAPDVGQKSGGKKSPEEQASAQSGGSRSKEATETGGSPTGGDIADQASKKGGEALKGPQGEGAPQPKIHNQSVPGVKQGLSDEQKQEVEQHNRDFDKKHDRSAAAQDDKVDKKFWGGTGGREGGSGGRKGGEIDWNA